MEQLRLTFFFLIKFRSNQLSLHQVLKVFSLAKYIDSKFEKSSIALSSECIAGVVSVPVQSFVYRMIKTGDTTVPCGEPVEIERAKETSAC